MSAKPLRLRLRIQDIDFEYLQLTVRGGKWNKDRLTVLPEILVPHIEHQMAFVRGMLQRDIDGEKSKAYVDITRTAPDYLAL